MTQKTQNQKYVCPWPISGATVEKSGINYKLFTLGDFHNFRLLAEDTAKWDLQYEKNACYVWSQSHTGSDYDFVKVFTVFKDCKPETVFSLVCDSAYRKTWDDKMIEGVTLCDLSENSHVGYYAVALGGIFSDREFVTQRAWVNCGEEFVLMQTSVDHNDRKTPTKSRERGEVLIAGYLFRPFGTNGTSVTYIAQSHLGGWVPSALINYLMCKLGPDSMQKMEKAAKGYDAWLTKNGNPDRPWLKAPMQTWPSAPPNRLHEMHEKKVADGTAK